MKKVCVIVFFLVFQSYAQVEDEKRIREIYTTALTQGKSYDWLNYLSNQIGGRLSGSIQAQQAVTYAKKQMDSFMLDRVWLQSVTVPKWVRGIPEFAYIETAPGVTTNVPICALGGSVATEGRGVKAKVIEVKSFDELETLGRENIAGKIVFINIPMNPILINTFEAYLGSVNQSVRGLVEAAKYGAVGVILRSMNLRLDDYPHTEFMSYGDLPLEQQIPAAAISTNGANFLSTTLKLVPDTKFYFKQNCKKIGDALSFNVIGEIKGSTYPDEVIVVGTHLDSWDLGDGAHDNGAGCVQSMEVLRIIKAIGYKPKRTIRVVLFMNTENGLQGAKKYAEKAKSRNENHIVAIESDSGGFTPQGFSFDSSEAHIEQAKSWANLFDSYAIDMFVKGNAGDDITPLKNDKIVLASLLTDSQRYFDYHHAANDSFEYVNKRELELGAATITSLVYLYDKYGVTSSIEEN